ncbi:urocanate hydratase [Algoriphagus lacus]|uniref:Urocanate hydratase n=1 Tax=Algoriphagus lacus TaxID=2056311 RepID=A0A418PRB4_9BACT|nr:urocanate hydratase [Algoriphagus lacus]RIW15098.1 urocanate hydratase [Algoriphagus lacus]
MTFQDQIRQGIPAALPPKKKRNPAVSHAPKRKDILTPEEKKLAIRNALRYFPKEWHTELAEEFLAELKEYGRIYMYRFMPDYPMNARPISEYPAKSAQAAAIMLMIQNNLDPAVAQHPEELITYGGNGAVFQNWAQYLLTMKYLSEMNEEQTLHMYSGHPMGLFPSSSEAPRVIVTNGMMIPNYSKPDDWERFNALGVTQYGQMTAGSYMYIGPQGIVHGTTITVMNAFRKKLLSGQKSKGKIFLTAGLGGMSGAQPKAGNIAGCVTVCAEVNPAAARKRHSQGWVDELIEDLSELVKRVQSAKKKEEIVSIAYLGNVVDVWERFDQENILVEIGSDQTSLHNPWAGGYYPVGLSFEESNQLMSENPEEFKVKVQESLRRHAAAINQHAAKGTYFFDYGNAFLLEASRAGAEVMAENGIDFRYPSYVQDILGPMCFDYGFGPFRWVCTSGKAEDLRKTDQIAALVLKEIKKTAPESIAQQLQDNITWIQEAEKNSLVVGSQARILYADAEGRSRIAEAFNRAIEEGKISAPVVLGRDHHDVSGTDSPYRETSNIYDGSRFTADMAIHNVIGDSFRGATWVSIHNGGGVGWGEVINGGFGLVLDGSQEAERRLKSMLFYDVNNGIARRAWARNSGSLEAIQREMDRTPGLKVTIPNLVDEVILNELS